MSAAATSILATILASPDLPTLPTVASKLLMLMTGEDTSLADIAKLVSRDMALVTKILRVTNSSFYNFSKQITTVQQAVALLGTNAVRSLVLSFSLLSLKGGDKRVFDYTRFWEQALAGATAARVIGRHLPGADQDELFVAGLLQNIGQLIFAATIPAQYEQALVALAAGSGEAGQEAIEFAEIGITHSSAGYEVAKKWGLPEMHLQAICYHHQPADYPGGDEGITATVRVTALAGLVAEIFYSAAPAVAHRRFRQQAKALLGFGVLTINSILHEVAGDVESAAAHFGLHITPVKSVVEILHEANLKLNQLNLTYEELNQQLLTHKKELERLTAELRHKNNQLENQVNKDFLTEVANHRNFQSTLDQELNRCGRNAEIVSLLMVDIDLFKNVNDLHGHPAGDFVLKKICAIIQAMLRRHDLLARYGGEEFAIILPDTGPEKARLVAEKIRVAIENTVFHEGQIDIRITVSIGVASARPAYSTVKKFEFISWADEALYQAKHKGRNRIVCHQSAGCAVA